MPLIVLIWHSLYISLTLSPQFLFFVCYPANLILIIGIVFQFPLLVSVGFGWTLVAFPLWAYSAYLTGDCEISCMLFHVTGLLVGCLAVRYYSFPRFTWLVAVLFALFMQILSRFFTDEEYNINASYRVYDGWEGVFSNYTLYVIIMFVGFGIFFYLLTTVCNLLFHGKK